MKHKWKYIMLGGAGAIILLLVIWELDPGLSIKNGTISERSKQFIADQNNRNNPEWHSVRFTGKEYLKADNQKENLYKIGDCFALTLPFKIDSSKKLGDCFNQYILVEPKGLSIIYKDQRTYSSIDDISGITFRRRENDVYTEETHDINGKHMIIFKKIAPEFEKTAFYYDGQYLYIINVMTSDNRGMDEKFEEMLSSMQIYK